MTSPWQPMSTAPKDNTAILLRGGKPDMHHDALPDHLLRVVVAWWDAHDNAWRFACYDGGYYGQWFNPEAWMPLPDKGTNDAEAKV